MSQLDAIRLVCLGLAVSCEQLGDAVLKTCFRGMALYVQPLQAYFLAPLDMYSKLNVFTGPDALRDFHRPDKNIPLPVSIIITLTTLIHLHKAR